MIGDFLRNSGKHLVSAGARKVGKKYSKTNKALKSSFNHPKKWGRKKKK